MTDRFGLVGSKDPLKHAIEEDDRSACKVRGVRRKVKYEIPGWDPTDEKMRKQTCPDCLRIWESKKLLKKTRKAVK